MALGDFRLHAAQLGARGRPVQHSAAAFRRGQPADRDLSGAFYADGVWPEGGRPIETGDDGAHSRSQSRVWALGTRQLPRDVYVVVATSGGPPKLVAMKANSAPNANPPICAHQATPPARFG